MFMRDCGQASKVTMGQTTGFWTELGFAPFNRNVCYIYPPPDPRPPFCNQGDVPDKLAEPLDLSSYKEGIDS